MACMLSQGHELISSCYSVMAYQPAWPTLCVSLSLATPPLHNINFIKTLGTGIKIKCCVSPIGR